MSGSRYFPHDYNARNDRKLARLIYKYGMTGIGLYWCVVEMLYENDGYLLLSECECIANELRTNCDIVTDIIKGELFENDGNRFWSNSVLERLGKINEKSQKARKSASRRWVDANAMPTQCEGNAIKEKKTKVNKIKENNKDTLQGEKSPSIYNSALDNCHSFDEYRLVMDAYPDKVAFLVDAFKKLHPNAPGEDMQRCGGRLAGIWSKKGNDTGYIFKVIWDTSSIGIAGSHLDYIYGVLFREKKQFKGKDPDRFTKGKYGHVVER